MPWQERTQGLRKEKSEAVSSGANVYPTHEGKGARGAIAGADSSPCSWLSPCRLHRLLWHSRRSLCGPSRAHQGKGSSTDRPAGLAQGAATLPSPFIPGSLPENGEGGTVDKVGIQARLRLQAACCRGSSWPHPKKRRRQEGALGLEAERSSPGRQLGCPLLGSSPPAGLSVCMPHAHQPQAFLCCAQRGGHHE